MATGHVTKISHYFFYKQMLRGCENLICAKAFNRQKSVESLFVGKQGFVISAMVINIEN